jgi:hypothetical protein
MCNCGQTTETNISVIFAYFETYYTNIEYGNIYIIVIKLHKYFPSDNTGGHGGSIVRVLWEGIVGVLWGGIVVDEAGSKS